MPLSFHSISSTRPSFTSTKFHKVGLANIADKVALCLMLAVSVLVHAQSPATAPSGQPGRIIVKIKPSLAQEAEAQFSTAAVPLQTVQIRAGQTGSARIESFLHRHSARQLSPLYPGMIRAKKQRGWSDAQLADNIRQRFASRARRTAHPAAAPEISRTYLLEFGSISAAEKVRLSQQLKADPEVEFAELGIHTRPSNYPTIPFSAAAAAGDSRTLTCGA